MTETVIIEGGENTAVEPPGSAAPIVGVEAVSVAAVAETAHSEARAEDHANDAAEAARFAEDAARQAGDAAVFALSDMMPEIARVVGENMAMALERMDRIEARLAAFELEDAEEDEPEEPPRETEAVVEEETDPPNDGSGLSLVTESAEEITRNIPHLEVKVRKYKRL